MADISLEAVAGKLNRIGYEAFIQALRQAKSAGQPQRGAGALAAPHPAEGPIRPRPHGRSLQARPRQAADGHRGRGQGLPPQRDRDAGHLQHRDRSARPRLALRHAVLRRDPNPHRPPAGGWAQDAGAAARVHQRLAGVRQDQCRRARGRVRQDLGRIGRGEPASDGRVWAASRPARPAPRRRRARAARPRSTAIRRISPPRPPPARWTRSSAATTRSASSSTC